jgi:hypothetical protein
VPYTPPTHGQSDWDVTLNQALSDIDLATKSGFAGMALKGFEPFPRLIGNMDAKVVRGDASLAIGVSQISATVTTLRAITRATAATTPTLVRMGIYSLSGSSAAGATATLVARTASSTTMFTTAWAYYSAALDPAGGYPSSYTFVPGKTYATALLVVGGTTDPVYYGVPNWGNNSALEPILTNNFSSQTDLAASYTIGTNCWDIPWIGAT